MVKKEKRDPNARPILHKPLTALSKKSPPSKLLTRRLILKKLDARMAREIFTTVDLNRNHLGKFLPWVKLINSISDETQWINLQKEKWANHSQFVYAIFLSDGKTYIGNIDAHAIDWTHHKLDLGYWLAKDHEGFGFMTEAVKVVMDALYEIGFHRIVIQCNTKNRRSAKVPLRCGFRLEGILRQDAIENGVYRDTMVFSKLARIKAPMI